jgi:hypothetical protein
MRARSLHAQLRRAAPHLLANAVPVGDDDAGKVNAGIIGNGVPSRPKALTASSGFTAVAWYLDKHLAGTRLWYRFTTSC